MFTYSQTTGDLKHDGALIGAGYSGCRDGKNNPRLQDVPNIGPIPIGRYYIGEPHDTEEHGPFVLTLTPDPKNLMWGRVGFLMHGDSVAHPGEASKGCIAISRIARERVAASKDPVLEVTI